MCKLSILSGNILIFEAYSYLGIVMLEGGTDTSAAYLQSLVLLLTACPKVQKIAQKAIDAVVGDARLPVLDDIKQLPYIKALIKEVGDTQSKYTLKVFITRYV